MLMHDRQVLTVKGSAARTATTTKKKTAEKVPSSADMEKARRKASQGSTGGRGQRISAANSVPGSDANRPHELSADSQSGKRRRKTVTSLASGDGKGPPASVEPAPTSSGNSDVSPSPLAANPSQEDDLVSIDDGGPRAKRTRSAKTGAKDKESVAGRSTRSRAASGKANGSAAAVDFALSGSRSSRRVSTEGTANTTALTDDESVVGSLNSRHTRRLKGGQASVPAEGKRRFPRREVAKATAASRGVGGGKAPLVDNACGEELGGSDDSGEEGGGVDEDDDGDYCDSNGSDSES